MSVLFRASLLFAWRRLRQGQGTCTQSETLIHINSPYSNEKVFSRGKIVHYYLDSEIQWYSPLLIQNTNLHLTVIRSELGTKLNVIKSQI